MMMWWYLCHESGCKLVVQLGGGAGPAKDGQGAMGLALLHQMLQHSLTVLHAVPRLIMPASLTCEGHTAVQQHFKRSRSTFAQHDQH